MSSDGANMTAITSSQWLLSINGGYTWSVIALPTRVTDNTFTYVTISSDRTQHVSFIYAGTSTGNIYVVRLNNTLSIVVEATIYPAVDNQYDLGSSTLRFRDSYFSNATVHIGDTALSTDVHGNMIARTYPNSNYSAIPGGDVTINFMVAVGSDSDGSRIKYTTNGTTWDNIIGDNDLTTGSSIAFNGTTWIAVGTGNGYSSLISQDGKMWRPPTSGAELLVDCRDIAYNAADSRWYAVGIDASCSIIRSTDSTGNDWEEVANVSRSSSAYCHSHGRNARS
jgi:hypothetical protein